MTPRKTPILLRRAPLSNRVMALHRYTRKEVRGREVLDTGMDGKQDVNDDFETLMVMFLMDDGAPDLVALLEGAAEGIELDEGERQQLRVVWERVRDCVLRHNARIQEPA